VLLAGKAVVSTGVKIWSATAESGNETRGVKRSVRTTLMARTNSTAVLVGVHEAAASNVQHRDPNGARHVEREKAVTHRR